MDREAEQISYSRAFPTMGIILLGGLSDDIKRYPLHTSAGITYTDVEESMFAEVKLFSSAKRFGIINGTPVTGTESRSPFHVIDLYGEKIREVLGADEKSAISFDSWSRNIPSGSSDAAAAAFGSSIDAILGGTVDQGKMENRLRTISESVGRSMKGGLTITTPLPEPSTELLLPHTAFSGYEIIAFRFPDQRKPSDEIHRNIVNSPEYPERVRETENKGKILRDLASSGDVEAIFDLSEKDTMRYHSIIESVGVNVITSEMASMLKRLQESRERFWNRFIVTGGSNVFAAIRKEDRNIALEIGRDFQCTESVLKVAGPPVAQSMVTKKRY